LSARFGLRPRFQHFSREKADRLKVDYNSVLTSLYSGRGYVLGPVTVISVEAGSHEQRKM
jgi:hypothetical protein